MAEARERRMWATLMDRPDAGEGAGVGLEMTPGFPASELVEVSKKQTQVCRSRSGGGA